VPKSRLLSLIVAGCYLICIAVFYFQGKFQSIPDTATAIIILLIWIAVSLLCIWGSDEIGQHLGSGQTRGFITPQWGIFVRFVGWVLLLLPAVIFIAKKIK
jgi:hypothetical protein